MIDVVVLCGGRGLRLGNLTRRIPKALVPLRQKPLIEHVMALLVRNGYSRFILAAGFGSDLLDNHFGKRASNQFEVKVVDTGLESPSGERLYRVGSHIQGDTFILTYCDFIADIDVAGVMTSHRRRNALGTIVVTPMPCPYGVVITDSDTRISSFEEKPVLREVLINAGFMVFQRALIEISKGLDLERQVLPQLASQGKLIVHHHLGCWQSVDTLKDLLKLEDSWPLAHPQSPPAVETGAPFPEPLELSD